MKKCIARKVFTLTHDAPNDEAFLRMTEESLGALDSRDIGDAMGAWVAECEALHADDFETQEWVFPGDSFLVTVSFEWGRYEWE